MEKIKFFGESINVVNKSVILRSDFNVPVKNKIIKDTTRIDMSIPFINSLIEKKAKIYLITHLGRPKSFNEKDLSLMPVFNYLKSKIKNSIYFHDEKIDEKTKYKTSFLKQGEVLLFENLRFNVGETQNDETFAKNLSVIGDIFINDAFSCSHRRQASIHSIAKYIKNSYASPNFHKELSSIDRVLNSNKKPISCIIGGSKVSTKIGLILSLIKKVDNIIIVGAMANNFLKFQGHKVGGSLLEENSHDIIKKIYEQSKNNNCKIIIPSYFKVSYKFDGKGINKYFNNILEKEIILDIGLQNIKKINDIIDNSRTVLWNGPAGYFENRNFSLGTVSIAKKISENTAKNLLFSIVGGGDTVSAIKNNGVDIDFTHLSTAGGAFLEYIEGKNLPGIEVLK